jgi:hypothetical protein
MSEYNKPCGTCGVEIRMSNNTGKWLAYDLDGSPHKCNPVNTAEAEAGKERIVTQKETDLIELVDMEERMEHAAKICTEIRAKLSELELVISRNGRPSSSEYYIPV